MKHKLLLMALCGVTILGCSSKKNINSQITPAPETPIFSKPSTEAPGPSESERSPSAQDDTVNDFDSLSLEILEEVNLARTEPHTYAQKIRSAISEPADSWKEETIEELENTKPMVALEISKGLSLASQDHVIDQGIKGTTGHTSTNGDTLSERVARYGKWDKSLAENISYGLSTAQEIVIQLLVDRGVESRGHRKNLLNPSLKFVGIGHGQHKNYGYMCVMDYAGSWKENLE